MLSAVTAASGFFGTDRDNMIGNNITIILLLHRNV